jgi:hypothetical protein
MIIGGMGLKVFLNGKEIEFAEGGYEYIFLKPYQKHHTETIKEGNRELTIQLYDNGVQIRTLVTKEEVAGPAPVFHENSYHQMIWKYL